MGIAYIRVTNQDAEGLPTMVDTGCEESATCLACPLPICRFEDDHWYRLLQRDRRDNHLVSVFQQTLEANPGTKRAKILTMVAEAVRLKRRVVAESLRRKGYAAKRDQNLGTRRQP